AKARAVAKTIVNSPRDAGKAVESKIEMIDEQQNPAGRQQAGELVANGGEQLVGLWRKIIQRVGYDDEVEKTLRKFSDAKQVRLFKADVSGARGKFLGPVH